MSEMLSYAARAYAFVLPMNGVSCGFPEWVALIKKSFDERHPRTAAVIQALEAAPAGAAVVRHHGGAKVQLLIPAAG